MPNLPQDQKDWPFLPVVPDTIKSCSDQSNVHQDLTLLRYTSKGEMSTRAQPSSEIRRFSSPQREDVNQHQFLPEKSKSTKARKRKRGFDAQVHVRRSARIAARPQQPRGSTAVMCAAGPEIYQARVFNEAAKSSPRNSPTSQVTAFQARARHQIRTSLKQDYVRTRHLVPPAPPIGLVAWSEEINLKPPLLNMVWPHRLLHVPSMTSFIRHGFDTYNNVTAPSYNIISYTWGNFVDPSGTPILVEGIDWPIPPIKSDHFTAASFQTAIERAACGVKHQCDWLWVDIACIPQWHQNETAEAKHLRGQEIGRQVQIFRRAQEIFAWLSHLRRSDLSPVLPLVTVHEVADVVSSRTHESPHAHSANEYLESCDRVVAAFDNWIRSLLAHPYFSSLWTLQEMTLREGAWVLLDDGLLPDLSTLRDIDSDIRDTQDVIWSRKPFLETAEKTVRAGNLTPECTHEKLCDQLNKLRQLQECKGLDALEMRIPHRAYSLAQHRNTSRLTDRIYGIVQTYDISCGSDPKGATEAAKLRTLEDEFGMKLVTQTGFVSQLFIHNSVPRRSWLITPKCTVSPRWKVFSDRERITDVRASLVVSEQTKDLEFCGRAWHLVSLLDSTPTEDQAMMLDDHVAKEVLGQTVDHFRDRRSMKEAGERLLKCYGRSVRAALLASVPSFGKRQFVGLLVAPLGELEESPPWVRIGLFWWEERSRLTHKDVSKVHHSFQCVIK